MKKFIIIVIICIVAAGAGLFFGWAEFAVPPGHYGVLRSKSHGLYEKTLSNGGRTWLWYKLIPTNAKVSAFSLVPQTLAINVRGTLPQAEVYGAFTGLKADFSYDVRVLAEYTLKKENLPRVVSENDIYTQEELNLFLLQAKDKIENFISCKMNEFAQDDAQALRHIYEEQNAAVWKSFLDGNFDFFDWDEISFALLKEPGFGHYEAAKTLYMMYLEQQHETLQNRTAGFAGERVASQFKLDELAKYGELLTRYPVLLEYLKITEGAPPELPRR
ncbi:MAG: hypothetical protein LBG74_00840 [Spirochaetaceae bacterium]|jgi:hypothetical protein|nr:hypothetical protein [Spirochaetaceae bacterium]